MMISIVTFFWKCPSQQSCFIRNSFSQSFTICFFGKGHSKAIVIFFSADPSFKCFNATEVVQNDFLLSFIKNILLFPNCTSVQAKCYSCILRYPFLNFQKPWSDIQIDHCIEHVQLLWSLQVKVVKCTVGGICVDISFNQTAGLCALYFLEQVQLYILYSNFLHIHLFFLFITFILLRKICCKTLISLDNH